MNLKGNPKGSLWNKWDLHVHTPYSIEQHYGDANKSTTWEQYFSSLEALPTDIKVIGVNDYFSIDGYKHVLKAKKSGRLQNIELILPVVELRFNILTGNKKTQKINYHIIFSNQLSSNEIEAHFLTKLSIEYQLSKDGNPYVVMGCDRASLEQLGNAIIKNTPEEKRSSHSSLKVGFENAVFSVDKVKELCNQSIFENQIITAIGITEWANMRFDGGGTGIKRDLINSSDIVFVASPSIESYKNRRNQLLKAEVNSNLIDCSDAHYLSSSNVSMRLGNVFTWFKADLTFEGLRRAINCFNERTNVAELGRVPEKLSSINQKKGKFIENIEIKKKIGSTLQEKWFDCNIPFNSDLVAIIGNQGSGKSALTDIIALCGNSHTSHFSFLSKDKFRDREKKASDFEATLYWGDGTQVKRSLDENIQDTEVERVRYVPQHFFDVITNETAVDQQSQFYNEIKKVIFSHIDKSDRIGCSHLDELVNKRTKETERTLISFRKDLELLNEKIYALEQRCRLSEIERLSNLIVSKEKEIETHKLTRPQIVEEPTDSAEINSQIDVLRQGELEIEEQIETLDRTLTDWKTRRELITQTRHSAENTQRDIQSLVNSWQQEFDENNIELKADKVISIQVRWELFDNEIAMISAEIIKINQQLDENNPESLIQEKRLLDKQKQELQNSLEESSKAYQHYLSDEQAWQTQQANLIGDKDRIESLEWIKHQKYEAEVLLPQKLNENYAERRKKAKEIHNQLWKLATIYQELTQSVREYIANNDLTRERYRLQFNIQLTEQGFIERFFQRVKHRGSFYGIDESKLLVENLLKAKDFNVVDDSIDFVEEIYSKLHNDQRQEPPTSENISQMVRKEQSVVELYNFIFGLDFLNPQYTISLNGKPLNMLSPGERGILLLVFYLVVDQGDEPLIIDQPEGNLNNQAIVKDLIPVFKEAKKRRQIIVVTHNPNLAVVSDAEQIIHAQIDLNNGNKVHFESGAMENPKFNYLMVDVLEGTAPALKTRTDTYYAYS